jgi:hypothetical protein
MTSHPTTSLIPAKTSFISPIDESEGENENHEDDPSIANIKRISMMKFSGIDAVGE